MRQQESKQQRVVSHEATARFKPAATNASHGVGDLAGFPTEVADLVLSCLDESCRKTMHMVCKKLRWALLRQVVHEIGYLGALLKAVQKLLPQPAAEQATGNLHPLLPHPVQQVAEAEGAGQVDQAAAQPAHVAAEAGDGAAAALAADDLDVIDWEDADGFPPFAVMHDPVPQELQGRLEVAADVREGGRSCSMRRVLDSTTQRQYVEQKLLQSMLQERRLTERMSSKKQKQKAHPQHKQQQQQQRSKEQQKFAAGVPELGNSTKSTKAAAAAGAAVPATSLVRPANVTKKTKQHSGSSNFRNAQFEYRYGGRYLSYGVSSSKGWEDQVCVNLRMHLTLPQAQAELVQARLLQGGILDYLEKLMPCRTEVSLHLACRAAMYSIERSYLTQNLQGRQHPQLVPQTKGQGFLWPA